MTGSVPRDAPLGNPVKFSSDVIFLHLCVYVGLRSSVSDPSMSDIVVLDEFLRKRSGYGGALCRLENVLNF